MADNTLIPPVGGNHPIPKSRRPVPADRDQQKRPPKRRTPERESNNKDDDRPSIDEYA